MFHQRKGRVHNETNQHQSLHALCTISHQRVSIQPSIYFVLLDVVVPYIFNNRNSHYFDDIKSFEKFERIHFFNVLCDVDIFRVISKKIVRFIHDESSFNDLSTLMNELLKFIRCKNARLFIRSKNNILLFRTLMNQVFCRCFNNTE